MSECGQDTRIRGLLPPADRQRTAVDVGANDGIVYSNTLELERGGWDVISVEANPLLAPDLWKNRRRPLCCAVGPADLEQAPFTYIGGGTGASWSALEPRTNITGQILTVPVRTLNWILAASGWDRLDLLSIDIEGGEMAALAALDFEKWAPALIVVENWGKDEAFKPLLAPHGYTLVDRILDDEFWLREG
jgi:FkbM family methyltransferase